LDSRCADAPPGGCNLVACKNIVIVDVQRRKIGLEPLALLAAQLCGLESAIKVVVKNAHHMALLEETVIPVQRRCDCFAYPAVVDEEGEHFFPRLLAKDHGFFGRRVGEIAS
jgi:hypothetical protein